MTSRVWFITGFTGFVGRELARRILTRSDDRIIALVRARDERVLVQRRDRVLAELFGADDAPSYADRVEPLAGELGAPRLGLDDATWQRVATTCDRLVHSAASVRFDLPLADARTHNVEGTRKVLELALHAVEHGRLERMAYVGTCYVAGDRTGVALADELDEGQGFRNTYEQTKLESEAMVREHMDRVPIAIFRPSIIVGDSHTGETSSFNVIYWPVRVYARGWWPIFIGNLDAPSDVVPIDYVTDAMLHILDRDDCVGGCYPLCAGVDGCTTNETLMRLASEYFEQPLPEIITPAEFTADKQVELYERLTPAQRSLIGQGVQYMPYMAQNPTFDDAPTRAALDGSGIAAPRVEDYFANLFDFCARTDWGRRPDNG